MGIMSTARVEALWFLTSIGYGDRVERHDGDDSFAQPDRGDAYHPSYSLRRLTPVGKATIFYRPPTGGRLVFVETLVTAEDIRYD